MKYQVFISYRREGGSALALLIRDRLLAAGFTTFLDLESLGSGRYKMDLLQRIAECRDVLIILSPHALDRCDNEGDIMTEEIAYALEKEKNIIPLMVDGFEWPKRETLPDKIQNLPQYNGVSVSFDFFDSVMSNVMRRLTDITMIDNHASGGEQNSNILFWGDFGKAYLDKIKNRLGLNNVYDINILDDPLEILSENLQGVFAIILIVADCTKFSSNPIAVQRIGETIKQYVSDGGKLICAHDVIYRRTRNEILQEVCGCKISEFRLTDNVEYRKTQKCVQDGAFLSLPERFLLHDGEICWGKLAADVDIYFETEDGIPLVFSREYGQGLCINLNSGEFNETVSESLLKPEKEFVDLLREAILMNSTQ